MLSPALPIAICLTAYILVIAVICQRKLRGVSPWRRLLSMLFPASQLCLALFALSAAAAYGALPAPVVVVAVAGVACGPVDILLFRALRDACFRAQAAEQVRWLEGELATQELLRERSAHESEEADRIGQRIRVQLRAAEADLRARRALEAGESLDRAIDAAGGSRVRYCAHPAIDALVRLKAEDAHELGARFNAQLHAPLDLVLPSAEICAVFSNLIDNALAACRLVAQEERFIDVTARLWGHYFVVDVENSCTSDDSTRAVALSTGAPSAHSGDKGRLPAVFSAGEKPDAARPSRRANVRGVSGGEVPEAGFTCSSVSPAVPDIRTLHGWGCGIVDNIAARHDGRVSVESGQGRYHVRVILRLEGGDAR